MMRDRRCPAVLTLLLVLGLAAGCAALRYDEPGLDASSAAASAPDAASASTPVASSTSQGSADAVASPIHAEPTRRETPTRARLARRNTDATERESARDWRELTQLARQNAQAGKFDKADELLAQAALQLKDRRPTNTQRRTVFGLRARLAHDMAAAGETEKADALANQLFDDVRAEPALADTALVTLARSTAERRKAAAEQAGREESQLPLLALAFTASQSGTASRERLGLAFEVALTALREGDLDLARRAIDQAVLDAQIVAPSDRGQAAALKIYKTRIAVAQRDLETAEATAHAALRTFEQVGADPSSLGVAEATLGQVLAEKGEHERALELGRAAYARLAGSETIVPHARRQIAACLARIEWLSGDRDAAGAHYREALSIPADGSDRDADLIRDIKLSLADLETSPSAALAP
jgi:hypothetical protein